jgi:hypothetical protein
VKNYEDRYFDEMVDREESRIRESEEKELIQQIHAFIDKRTEEDENGEPPDEDTIVEALDLGNQEEIVSKAYELYWKR